MWQMVLVTVVLEARISLSNWNLTARVGRGNMCWYTTTANEMQSVNWPSCVACTAVKEMLWCSHLADIQIVSSASIQWFTGSEHTTTGWSRVLLPGSQFWNSQSQYVCAWTGMALFWRSWICWRKPQKYWLMLLRKNLCTGLPGWNCLCPLLIKIWLVGQ